LLLQTEAMIAATRSGRALAALAAHLRPADGAGPGLAAAAAAAASSTAAAAGLRHVVLFRFSPSATEAQKAALVEAFAALPAAIPTIVDYEYSLNVAGAKYAEVGQGFTHCFCLTFGSEADRDAYLPHPAHTAFGAQFVRPCVEGVFVFDYWAMDGAHAPAGPRKGSLRRTVAARFPADSTAEQRDAVYAGDDSFAKIMGGLCASYEWGTNNSPEGKDLGFTHCFTLGFEDEAQREAWSNTEGMSETLKVRRVYGLC
jgi:hypothetical protein